MEIHGNEATAQTAKNEVSSLKVSVQQGRAVLFGPSRGDGIYHVCEQILLFGGFEGCSGAALGDAGIMRS